jgi:hypothetical protein
MNSTTAASVCRCVLRSPSAPATSSSRAGRSRLPPALMMYSEIWLISITSDARLCRMTRFTCSMSLAMGASRVAALGVGVAVDDMMANRGSAADYKANRPRAGRSSAFRLMVPSISGLWDKAFAPVADARCTARRNTGSVLVNPFDREANSMYNLRFRARSVPEKIF